MSATKCLVPRGVKAAHKTRESNAAPPYNALDPDVLPVPLLHPPRALKKEKKGLIFISSFASKYLSISTYIRLLFEKIEYTFLTSFITFIVSVKI